MSQEGFALPAADVAAVAAPLPRPMLANNFESSGDKCFLGPAFVSTVGRAGLAGWRSLRRRDCGLAGLAG